MAEPSEGGGSLSRTDHNAGKLYLVLLGSTWQCLEVPASAKCQCLEVTGSASVTSLVLASALEGGEVVGLT